jgi:mycothiol synthase
MTLPDGWTVRHPTLRDVSVILEIATASGTAADGEPDWSVEEITETLTAPNHDPAHDSWLVANASGEPVAWAYLANPTRSDRDSVEVYVVPGRGEAARVPLLELAVARVAERAREAGQDRVRLRAATVGSAAGYVEALRATGFAFVKRHVRMRVALPVEGSGRGAAHATIRPVHPDELRRFHDVLESAFADVPEPYEAWLERIAKLPSVDWDEWLVATVDGTVVGVLQSSSHAVERNEGWVRNLAVLREHRGSGIGTALLRVAFERYAAKGRKWAGLGVDLTNRAGAYRLYVSVGMVPVYEADVYERAVQCGSATRTPYP